MRKKRNKNLIIQKKYRKIFYIVDDCVVSLIAASSDLLGPQQNLWSYSNSFKIVMELNVLISKVIYYMHI